MVSSLDNTRAMGRIAEDFMVVTGNSAFRNLAEPEGSLSRRPHSALLYFWSFSSMNQSSAYEKNL